MRHIVAAAIFRSPLFPKSRSSVKAVRLKHNLAASPILSDIPATSSRIELECSGTAVVGAKDDSPLTSSLPSLSAVAHEHLRPRRLSPFGVECLSRGRTPSSAARRIGHLEMAGKGLGQGETAAGFWPPSGRPSKPFRVGLYARVSTQEEQTIPLQSRAMRQYATRRGWMQVPKVGSGAVQRQSREKLLEAACPPGNRWGAGLAAGSRGDRSPSCRSPRRLRRNLTRISGPPWVRVAKRGAPASTRQTLPQPPSPVRHRRWSADRSA